MTNDLLAELDRVRGLVAKAREMRAYYESMTDWDGAAIAFAQLDAAKSAANSAATALFRRPDFLALIEALREPVGWATHHDVPMLFPTLAEAAGYCGVGEEPIPLIALPTKERE